MIYIVYDTLVKLLYSSIRILMVYVGIHGINVGITIWSCVVGGFSTLISYVINVTDTHFHSSIKRCILSQVTPHYYL